MKGVALPPPLLRDQPEVLPVEFPGVLLPQVDDCLNTGQLQEFVVCHGVAVVDYVEHSLQGTSKHYSGTLRQLINSPVPLLPGSLI